VSEQRTGQDECAGTWPPDATCNQMRLWCTLPAGHDGPHEAWTTTGTVPYKTWGEASIEENGR
jgi:hypothetical protein